MKESTISSEEMSISTPRAPVSAIRSVRSSCRVEGEPVVHVHLDGDQEELAHPQDRDAFHVAL